MHCSWFSCYFGYNYEDTKSGPVLTTCNPEASTVLYITLCLQPKGLGQHFLGTSNIFSTNFVHSVYMHLAEYKKNNRIVKRT